MRQILREVRPAVVVVNLSSNDKSSKGFESALRRLVDRIIVARARPVLVLEANAPAAVSRGLRARHSEVRRVAEDYGLPLIDLQGYLESRDDTGFLWWDLVHLTSFGQRLAAAKLFSDLAPILDPSGKLERRQEKGRPRGDRRD